MSRAAANDPDRPRDIVKEGGGRYRMGGCTILVGVEGGLWHLSIARKDRLPSWEEVREARYQLIPDEVTMAMLLPPKDEYVNLHPFCFHLWQLASERPALEEQLRR